MTIDRSAQPAGIDAYLICATPRTGSTLLCALLRTTEVAGRPESYFRQPDEQSWADRWRLPRNAAGRFDYSDYVHAAVVAGSTPNGVCGVRVMWGTLEEIVTTLGAVHGELAGDDLRLLTRAFGRTRFVQLWRDDVVAQAVSWSRAEQSGFWQDGDIQRPGDEPSFDFEQIHELVQEINEHNAAWRDWFAACDVEPYRVRYEEVVADPAGVTRGILEFLGIHLPADRVLMPGTRRQADQVNDDWITRYSALAGLADWHRA